MVNNNKKLAAVAKAAAAAWSVCGSQASSRLR